MVDWVDFDSKPNENIIFEWYPMMKCNFKCPYCYIRSFKKYSSFSKIDNAKHLVKSICLQGTPVTLNILGGEPTFYPYIKETLETFNEYNVMNIHHINIITNGSRDSFFKSVPFYKNIVFYFSYHPLETEDAVFFKNLEIIQDKGFQISSSIMLEFISRDRLEGVTQRINKLSIPLDFTQDWSDNSVLSCKNNSGSCYAKRMDYLVLPEDRIYQNFGEDGKHLTEFDFDDMKSKEKCSSKGSELCKFSKIKIVD